MAGEGMAGSHTTSTAHHTLPLTDLEELRILFPRGRRHRLSGLRACTRSPACRAARGGLERVRSIPARPRPHGRHDGSRVGRTEGRLREVGKAIDKRRKRIRLSHVIVRHEPLHEHGRPCVPPCPLTRGAAMCARVSHAYSAGVDLNKVSYKRIALQDNKPGTHELNTSLRWISGG